MPIYHYKAKRGNEEYEDTKEVADKLVLYDNIRKEGGTVLFVEEVKSKPKSSSGFSLFRRIKAEDKINFAKNLAVMVDAGLSINRALSVMIKQSSNKKLTDVLKSLEGEINQGRPLSEALKNHPDVFSDLFAAMVKSGEESGTLSAALRSSANQMEKNNSITKKVKGAMIYPSIVVSVMIVIGILMMIFMVPTLAATFKGLNVPLPLPTRMVIAISDFISAHILFLLLVALVLLLAGYYFLKSVSGKRFADVVVLHLPVIKTIAKEFNAARTTRTLSSLMSSGVDIVVAIGVAKDVVQNSFYKKVLNEATIKIEQGGSIASIFSEASDLYPVFVGEMIAVGEETGKIADMMENVASYYESEIDQKTKDLSTIIEPILMILIGIVVGGFAITMLLPTYSLVNVIQ